MSSSVSRINSDVCQMLGLLIDNSSYALEDKCNHNANIQCSHSDSGFSFNTGLMIQRQKDANIGYNEDLISYTTLLFRRDL